MILLSKPTLNETKKIHCPICGGRLCDTYKTEKIRFINSSKDDFGIIVKCHKCGSKIKINISD